MILTAGKFSFGRIEIIKSDVKLVHPNNTFLSRGAVELMKWREPKESMSACETCVTGER